MDHQSLILGELREFKRAALERLGELEKGMKSLQRVEAMRRGKSIAFSSLGAIIGCGMTLLVTWLAG